MQAENIYLYERAKKFLNSDRADVQELAYLNGEVTGIHYPCTNCNKNTMLYAVERYVNTTKIKIEPMATPKYRFKKEYQGSEVIIHGATTRSISQKNLTDEAAELLIKTRNGHVLEPNPDYVEPNTNGVSAPVAKPTKPRKSKTK